MIKRVLIPIPTKDFDPTEVAIPWKILKSKGVDIIFATPHARKGECDRRMLEGIGLGPLSSMLSATKAARTAYSEMESASEFLSPISWSDIDPQKFDGIILPGGHAKGVREYIESTLLQKNICEFFALEKPVGAICHGVVLAARSRNKDNRSVLFGRKTTALLASQEIFAWLLTCIWLGDYYRTYSQTVESEVRASLAKETDFSRGPAPLFRDTPTNLSPGFVVKDKNYLSARWPGDAHLFANKFFEMLT